MEFNITEKIEKILKDAKFDTSLFKFGKCITGYPVYNIGYIKKLRPRVNVEFYGEYDWKSKNPDKVNEFIKTIGNSIKLNNVLSIRLNGFIPEDKFIEEKNGDIKRYLDLTIDYRFDEPPKLDKTIEYEKAAKQRQLKREFLAREQLKADKVEDDRVKKEQADFKAKKKIRKIEVVKATPVIAEKKAGGK